MRSSSPAAAATVTPCSSTPTTVRSSTGVTPRCSSWRLARRDNDGGNAVSTRSVASTSSTRAWRGSIERKSPRSVSRASSAIWPAISTPVGPPPTTTNVSHARRRRSSCSSSAASKADRIRLARRAALSSDLTSGPRRATRRGRSRSSREPPATISVSYCSERAGPSPTTERTSSRRRSRSKPATSPSTTRTFRWRRKIARSG